MDTTGSTMSPPPSSHPGRAGDSPENGPESTDDATFSVGPPHPITDSRELPAVTGEDEASVVTGADLGDGHPDNDPLVEDVESPLTDADAEGPEDTVAEAELDELVADVDPDDIDDVGFGGDDMLGLEHLVDEDAETGSRGGS
jgi:hypothetical protein